VLARVWPSEGGYKYEGDASGRRWAAKQSSTAASTSEKKAGECGLVSKDKWPTGAGDKCVGCGTTRSAADGFEDFRLIVIRKPPGRKQGHDPLACPNCNHNLPSPVAVPS
jgi:hypothetical protein